jgi:hypothetical protein
MNPAKVLPEADRIDQREAHATGGKIREQPDHRRLQGRQRLLPAALVEVESSATRGAEA